MWHFRYGMKQQGVLPIVIECSQVAWGLCCRKEQYSLPHTFILLQSLPGPLLSLHFCPDPVWLCWLKTTSEQPASSGLTPTEPRAGPHSGALSLLLLKGGRGWGQWAGREEGAPFGYSAGWCWLEELMGTACALVGLSTHSHQGAFRSRLFCILAKHASALGLCRDLYWSSTEVPLSSKFFPCWHQLTRTALVYIEIENWDFQK